VYGLRWSLRGVVLLGLLLWMALDAAAENPAGEILTRIGQTRGICVLLDPEAATLAADLARRSELLVYLQLPADAAAGAREKLDDAGLLGTRVYVEAGDRSRLHLAENIADAVVVTPRAVKDFEGSRAELLRVVNPLGKVLLGEQEFTKPYPAEADDWTHPYHRGDNNPQSNDKLARSPYLTQFLAKPWYVPFPEVTVAAAGRVFKAFGHVGYKQRCWPWVNSLVAINGYNGTLLWKRPLEPGFNIHRNTMIATAETLYLADSRSCKLIDTASGEVTGHITVPQAASGPVWKWMAAEEGILYALVGKQEFRDPTLRGTRTEAGWPWVPMTAGYDRDDYPWGFGRTLFAVDLKSRWVLWTQTLDDPIDGRAICMKGGRIFAYSRGKSLACFDARNGKTLWRTSDRKLLDAVGPDLHAQRHINGFSSTVYLTCSDKAVYFAGPQRSRLVVVSADDGRLLWQYGDGNLHLVLRREGLYAMGRTGPSKLFDPLTGRVLAELPSQRGNCTRVTGTIDSIFARGPHHGGTLRLAVDGNRPQRFAPMRPDCHGGVITAGGLMYLGPWMCDCSLSLVGIVCLGPAGEFNFKAEATDAERLETFPAAAQSAPAAPLAIRPGDWPTFRADNLRSGASAVEIPAKVARAWQFASTTAADPIAPVTAGNMVFIGATDGVVRALDAASGAARWNGYTGGPISYPPALDGSRLLAGSGDGWVYAFEAATGRPLWRFRAAPVERKINVYGRLASTWPVAGGVLLADGVAYAAAGIASFDGTHVYALDARTGRIRWQNNTSGRLAGKNSVTGVSVQGHLLLKDNALYLAGGNVVSPAVYDIGNGRCLNTLNDEWAKAPRGRDLFLVGDGVVAFDRLLYAPKEYWAGRYFHGPLLQVHSGEVVVRGAGGRITRLAPQPKAKPLWESNHFEHAAAVALGTNAVVVAGRLPKPDGPAERQYAVVALGIADGRTLWSRPLPAMPVPWGLALDHAGRIFVAAEGGRVLCFRAAAD